MTADEFGRKVGQMAGAALNGAGKLCGVVKNGVSAVGEKGGDLFSTVTGQKALDEVHAFIREAEELDQALIAEAEALRKEQDELRGRVAEVEARLSPFEEKLPAFEAKLDRLERRQRFCLGLAWVGAAAAVVDLAAVLWLALAGR